MRATKKAMMLSGLVMPGLGQWTQGRRGKAVFIMAAVLGLLALMMARVFLIVYHGLLPTGDPTQFQLDPALLENIHRQAYAENWRLLVAILALWIGSVIDAWRVGKAREKLPPN